MYVDKNEVIEYSYIPTLLHIATLHKYKLKHIPDHTWPIDKAKNNKIFGYKQVHKCPFMAVY